MPSFSAVDLMTERLPEPRFAVPGLIPEGVSIVASRPKIGKSWMVLGWALAVASGGQAFGTVKVETGEVLYLALEDTRRRLQARLATILDDGQDPPTGLHLATEWPRLDVGGLKELDAWLVAHPDARLVIIDTLARARPRSKRREGPGYTDDYDDIAVLRELADRHRVAIVLVHHTRKAMAEDPLDTVSGTLGLNGSADAVLIIGRSRGAADATLDVSGRDIEEARYALSWSAGAGTWSIVDLPDADVSAERAEIIAYLRETGQPRTPTVIATVLGRNVGTVKRLCWQMAQDGQLGGGGRPGYHLLSTEPNEPRERTDSSEPGEPCEPTEPDWSTTVRSVRPLLVDEPDPPTPWAEVMT
jgi:hypothetical protein